MEKNRIRPVKAGKGMRMSYSRQKEVLEMPNLIEVQKDSYQWFLKEGLKEVFDDISPIADYSGHLSLEFVDFTLCESDVKYTIPECKERDATYAAPLKVKVRLHNKETDEINEHEIFMGDLPLMTETGTFVINGAERVIVSQLVRSPGIYYGIAHDKVGKKLYSCTVIPNRGAWLEYETDSNDVFYVRVDRTRKVPITVLIRALGIGTNQEIVDLFGEEPKILASFGKDVATNYEEGLLELYKKIRPGEPLTVESAESLISAMFFDPRRYDLAKVGRYKFNKKLMLKNRINGHVLAEDVVNLATGEIIAEAGTEVTRSLADDIQNAAVPYVWIQTETRNVKVLSSMMVDLRAYVDCNPKDLGITELVYYPVLAQLMEEHTDIDDLKEAIKKNVHDLIPKHITKDDIFASINYNMHLEYGIGNDDDIDHLGNRRIRAVGELLQNQYRIGLSRLERVVRERMTTLDLDGISPQSFRFFEDIKLYNDSLGLHGICDGAIFTENEVIPLEFKLSEVSPPMGARLQLAAYAMLLEYQEKIKISRGFVLYGQKGHTLEVIVDIKLRAEVLTVANLIRKACKKAIVPHTAATESQCAQCEYQNFCADRF